jgi:hypothetical protein
LNRLPRLLLLLLLVLIAIAPLFAGVNPVPAFQKIQLLAGDWEGKDEKGQPVKSNFKSMASGTAVLETLSPAGMEQIVTVYGIELRVVPGRSDPRELAFDFISATKLASPAAGHRHHLRIRFEDGDHITEAWTWRQDNRDMPMVLHLARKN